MTKLAKALQHCNTHVVFAAKDSFIIDCNILCNKQLVHELFCGSGSCSREGACSCLRSLLIYSMAEVLCELGRSKKDMLMALTHGLTTAHAYNVHLPKPCHHGKAVADSGKGTPTSAPVKIVPVDTPNSRPRQPEPRHVSHKESASSRNSPECQCVVGVRAACCA